ncbi:MAG TPA: HAMP domain-containing histidine kinase [Deltaproteobacteria bacterium]|nr:HAMP domain-containing histidine kinase [Deltaproteobacteria bacterium]
MTRFQLKIMGVLALLVLVVVGTTSLLAERGLRARTTENIQTGLEHEARLLALSVDPEAFDRKGDRPGLQRLVEAASKETGARFTLIDAGGRVIADSGVAGDAVATLPNHADRPEVIAAMKEGRGSRIRHSDTVKRSLVYVAIRVPEDPVEPLEGIVRVAVRSDRIDAAIGQLRRVLLTAVIVGFAMALGLSYLLSVFSLRPIIELRDVVRELAEGRLGRRLRWTSKDERGEIAASINRMARQIRDAADEATREKERLEAVLSSMVEGVIAVDEAGRIVLANPRAREMLSIWGRFSGRTLPEVIRFPEIDEAFRSVASEGIVVREIEVSAEKKRILLMHASGFPKHGPRAGTVAVFHDVTELRRVDAIRRDFVANASHELRTPLTAILGFAETLGHAADGEEDLSKHLDIIVRNAQRMSSLIDDLLTLSRIESGLSSLEIRAVDPARLVETIVGDFAPRFEQAGIGLHVHLAKTSPCLADHRAVEQILSNLLSNAARYSNPGSRVDVSLEEIEGFIEVSVEDTGIGIPSQDLERIFERFYRVDAARSRALGSTGLGLSIVKHLVNAMGGSVRVESEVGRGSRFVFRLPVDRSGVDPSGD